MRFGRQLVLALLALVGLRTVNGATAETGVTQSSPFVPANGGAIAVAGPSARDLEFVAVVGTGAKTTVGLYDPATRKTRLIPVGGEADGVAVLRYEARRDRIVIRTGGIEKTLVLRKEHAIQNASAPAPPPIGTSAPASLAAAPAPASTTSIAPAAPPAPATVSPPPPGAKPLPAPIPADVAKKQEDARLLTSDLLEIGLAQRQAYEAAQKQAADRARPTQPPSGATGTR
mgnify:CR=1 FL=1